MEFRSFPKIGTWQNALDKGNEYFLFLDKEKNDVSQATPRLYSAKFKLDGTNAGIQTDGKGNIVTQSRNRLLSTQTKTSDNNGFCAWVEKNLRHGWDQITKHVVLYGEFAGPGIMNRDACSKLPERMFFVFAVLDVEEDVFIFLPEEILKYVRPIIAANPGAEKIVHVIPEVSINSVNTVFNENLYFGIDVSTANNTKHPKPHPNVLADWQSKMARIYDEIVLPMETQDPYMKSRFGIDGKGEGIVMCANVWNGKEYRLLMFKIKTPHHAEDAAADGHEAVFQFVKDPHQVFAKRFVTPARCIKVRAAANEHHPENMNLFADALVHDVCSETVKELEQKGGWSKDYEQAVRAAATEWWTRDQNARAQAQSAAENQLADNLINNNKELLTIIADTELCTTKEQVDDFAATVAERLVPDSTNEQLLRKVYKRAKTWWLARNNNDKKKNTATL